MSRRIILEDEDEFFCPADIYLKAHKRCTVYGRYSVVYHKIEELISKKAPEAFRTAAEIRRRVRVANDVTFNLVELAATLGISRPTAYRHVRQLKELGVLIPKYDQIGQAWLIHPLYGWYGGGKAKDKYWKELAANHPFKQVMVEEHLEYPEEGDEE